MASMTSVLDDDVASSSDEEEELAPVAFILLAMLAQDHGRRECRRKHRTYLCRPQLLPNPRAATPWQWLYDTQDRNAFVVTMGVDPSTFQHILDGGFEDAWNTTAIPRPDTFTHGTPRLHARSLDAAGALGLVLHFLSSSMPPTNLQQIFALIPSTVSRYINFALTILLRVLRSMPEGAIVWPDDEQMDADNSLITARHPLLVGAIASIDGLRLPTQTSSDPYIENASYNGWTHDHNTVSVLVFSPRGRYLSSLFIFFIVHLFLAV